MCSDHSKNKEVLVHIHKSQKQRICDNCFLGKSIIPVPVVASPAATSATTPVPVASPQTAQPAEAPPVPAASPPPPVTTVPAPALPSTVPPPRPLKKTSSGISQPVAEAPAPSPVDAPKKVVSPYTERQTNQLGDPPSVPLAMPPPVPKMAPPPVPSAPDRATEPAARHATPVASNAAPKVRTRAAPPPPPPVPSPLRDMAPVAAALPAAAVPAARVRDVVAPPPPPPTAAVVLPLSTTPASDDGLGKYRKMVQMLPAGAVSQKMTNDGFSAAAIEAFMASNGVNSEQFSHSAHGAAKPPPVVRGAGGPPPPPPPPPPVMPVVPTIVSSGGAEEGPFRKYQKMKEMLPPGAVLQKMTADGFSRDDIEAFLAGTMTHLELPIPAAGAPSVMQSLSSPPALKASVERAPPPPRKASLLDEIQNGPKLRTVQKEDTRMKQPTIQGAGGLLGMLASEMSKRRFNMKVEHEDDDDSDSSGFSDSDSDSDDGDD